MAKRIAMLGAGSGFTEEITKGLCACELLHDSTFVLMDVDDQRLAGALERNQKIVGESAAPLQLTSTTDQRAALAGSACGSVDRGVPATGSGGGSVAADGGGGGWYQVRL